MEITRFNWPEVESILRSSVHERVTRLSIERTVIYRIITGGGIYDLPARLARELFDEHRLPDSLYTGMITACRLPVGN